MRKYLDNIFYHTLLLSEKELYNSNQIINNENLKHINDSLTGLEKKFLKMKILKR